MPSQEHPIRVGKEPRVRAVLDGGQRSGAPFGGGLPVGMFRVLMAQGVQGLGFIGCRP